MDWSDLYSLPEKDLIETLGDMYKKDVLEKILNGKLDTKRLENIIDSGLKFIETAEDENKNRILSSFLLLLSNAVCFQEVESVKEYLKLVLTLTTIPYMQSYIKELKSIRKDIGTLSILAFLAVLF